MDSGGGVPGRIEPPNGEVEHLRQVSTRKLARLVAALGATYAVLFLLSVRFINTIPSGGADDAEITAFYSSDNKRRVVLVGMYLLPFSAVAFLWFAALIRAWVTSRASAVNQLLASVQLASAIAFITLSFAAGAANTALISSVQFADATVVPNVARLLTYLSDSLQLVFAMRMAAIFVMTTTNIARSAGLFPRWFVVVSFVVAAFLFLSASLSLWLVLVFPLWVLGVSLLIFFESRFIPVNATIRPAR